MREELKFTSPFMRKNRRRILQFVAAILLILLYRVIFSFSGQDGAHSTGVSRVVSKKCVDVMEVVSHKEWTQSDKYHMTLRIEHPLRKTAHFCEYACMGILIYLVLLQCQKRKRLYLFILLWVFLSAASDEIHQYFVPGRSGCLADVLLDTCGGLCGIIVARCLAKGYRLAQNKINHNP